MNQKPSALNVTEAISRPPDSRKLAADQLRMAADLVAEGGERDDSASWRAIDALMELKELNPDHHLPGIDNETGRGGKLDMTPR